MQESPSDTSPDLLRSSQPPATPSELREWGDPYTPSDNPFTQAPMALIAPSSQYSDNFSFSTPFQANAAQNGAQQAFRFRTQSPEPQGAQQPQSTPQGTQQPQTTPHPGTQKRGANSPLLPNRTKGKTVRFDPPPAIPFSFQSTNSDSSEKLVLQARDLLVKAYSATQSREKQAKLLDLLEVFREFTEHGRIRNTSSILATQVANLERATKKIESTKPASYAQAAKSTNQAVQQPQTQVSGAASSSTSNSSTQRNRAGATSSGFSTVKARKPREHSKLAPSRRCTLLQTDRLSA